MFIEGDDFSDGKRETHSTELSVTFFLRPSTGGHGAGVDQSLAGTQEAPSQPFLMLAFFWEGSCTAGRTLVP